MNASVPIIGVVIGAAILLFGRKLFWLFVAALGFAMGLEIAAYFMREPPVWMTLLVALVLGVVGALLAILLQKLAIAVAGFIAGGRIAWALAAAFWVEHAHYRGITFVIGGILGALLLLALFDWVLILLSSVEGAHLIANGIVLPEKGLPDSFYCPRRDRRRRPGIDAARIAANGGLMPEMPDTGKNHRHIPRIRGRDHLLVAD
jgi:MFS family permease